MRPPRVGYGIYPLPLKQHPQGHELGKGGKLDDRDWMSPNSLPSFAFPIVTEVSIPTFFFSLTVVIEVLKRRKTIHFLWVTNYEIILFSFFLELPDQKQVRIFFIQGSTTRMNTAPNL